MIRLVGGYSLLQGVELPPELKDMAGCLQTRWVVYHCKGQWMYLRGRE